jgi:hypothetical protein
MRESLRDAFLDSFDAHDECSSPPARITDPARKWLLGVYLMTFGYPLSSDAHVSAVIVPETVKRWNAIPQAERDTITAGALCDRWEL